uniref:Reverse transcriptase zinc-binding domain-containing protein n=1 Tax=Tanacetum cinerariifolium TaxID=118510 RepID=A0A699I5N9_TANCI|nr:hypothetical protein [Tanacetum cinerariifolium]
MKPFFWVEIRNGLNSSLMYDRWCSLCPLIRSLTPRDITREGYTFQARVAKLLVNGAWNWPQAWLSKAPNIGTIAAPNLSDTRHDHLRWRDASGNLLCFLVKCAWELADMDNVAPTLMDIVSFIQPMGNSRMAKCIFGKLLLAATSYFIWTEHNNCLFKHVKRSPKDIRDMIMVTVRLKLLSHEELVRARKFARSNWDVF